MTTALGLLAVLALACVALYNMLIRRRNAAENAFAGIDVYLKMRYDLIPNLVETVRAYAIHEGETLQQITELRRSAAQPGLPTDARVLLDNRINIAMGGLFAVVEAYPDLKASENFQQLQRGLNEVEERISAARRYFNTAVMEYNNAVQQFPTNLLAGALGMQSRAFLSEPPEVHVPVRVADNMQSGA